ncbi:hypothetical protein [Streptosporangium roseum]|uniref:Uncharacterized protein n=1 Tax=Streptosporangium roseum (strain ATCC 12428 / DSM 43021 / JCM 3005 / KCTC 9067 / NCIMB 10171 / NRRL 2505 / NI 9100) TaxID=479432 RepID=D2ASI2_STRRD|nr:hypothetical protein [Streptosporangium roseum]ACZ88505.1 hypothetical protein Sros_5757 [Streptosporangium roseum DSM 43021]
MIEIRNALAAGTMVASALIAPVTMPAQSAGAESTARSTSTSHLTSVQKPCSEHKHPAKCRARRSGGGSGGGGGGKGGGDVIGGLDDDHGPGSSGGGAGINN